MYVFTCVRQVRVLNLHSQAMYLIGIVILIGSIAISYFLSQRSIFATTTFYRSQNCSVLGKDVLYGPEDMTVSHKHKLLFVSSHDRRGRGMAGALFTVNLTSNEVFPLPVSVPVPCGSFCYF